MTQPAEVDLARRAAAGDAGALAELWRRHRRWVAALLLPHLPRGHDLADLLQEVALALCQQISTLTQPERFASWLRSVALNRARSAGRRAESARRLLAGAAPGESDGAPLDSLPAPCGTSRDLGTDEAGAECRAVLEAVQRLPQGYAEPLLLKAVRGLSQREIARILELSETAVESRLARARRLLAARLKTPLDSQGSDR